MKTISVATIIASFCMASPLANAKSDAKADHNVVRHLKWGMTILEATKAEPGLRPGSTSTIPTIYSEKLSISNVPSELLAIFKLDNRGIKTLQEVVIFPDDSRPLPLKATVFGWYGALTRRYGKGSLFLGNSEVGHPVLLREFEDAVDNYLTSKIEFLVQFQYDDSVIDLYIEEPKGTHDQFANIEIRPIAQDNL